MLSSISLILMLLLMIIVPTILYTFFFLINCPSNPFQFLRRNYDVENVRSKTSNQQGNDDEDNGSTKDKKNSIELVATSNEVLENDVVECPVCLSVFVQGEELKQLKTCKHMFHTSCIDKWLSTHCNCPVCRAFIGENNHAKKELNNRVLASRDVDMHDLWQGLPDSAGLV